MSISKNPNFWYHILYTMTAEQIIRERIKHDGCISFRDFMDIALYAPQCGYYMKNSTEIGRGGDFFTASNLHMAFGWAIARQIEEMWQIMKNPETFYIIEYGGGSGLICFDILTSLKGREIFNTISYVIVERNPHFQLKQKARLTEFSDRITWTAVMKDFPQVKGCVISNELIDSFPVHLIEAKDGKIEEVYVDKNFNEKFLTPAAGVIDYLNEFNISIPLDLAHGYRTEINLETRVWLSDVSEYLAEGFILTIDYGYPAWEYYASERFSGTLMCYHKHRAHENPYINIGSQDITAHVNFTSLKTWGEAAGFNCLGFCPQGTFLVSLGIDEFLSKIAETEDFAFQAAKVKRLITDGGMGVSHKVMIQYKGDEAFTLRGFSLRNRVASLLG
ncbi:class I SAM-dependent methyltransferase [Candidatus Magnetomonas plexicatena]|uniref:class I SAM-dependent methyltransferase n=1 Tax=Candidatus Magnetomonas plexicatena TaxID=2552947 RepID=UPI0011010E5B|nr:methyltransferase [Nitrospirales bacterium LBB_01]